MESAREARRRKILERGSVRLAFVTGQTGSLPPSSSSTTTTAPPSASPPPPPEQRDLPAAVAPPSEYVATGFELPKSEPSKENIVDPFPKLEEINEAENVAPYANWNSEPSAAVGSSDRAVQTAPHVARNTDHQIFTASRVAACVSASENIRLLFAVTIALLVVLSYHGYPVGGKLIRSTVSFRPIYLVLVTDATLMLGLLMATQGHVKVEGDTARSSRGGEYHWSDQMGKALEAALVFKKVLNAAFMDCCVCAVIMISCIPFGAVPDKL